MAKKKQQKEKKVQDTATLSRINFLHQAAQIVPLPLQRHYLTTSKVAMKKTMLKLDPKLKRLTCRRCAAMISPQSTNVTTRLVEGHRKGVDMVEVECRHCGTKRRFPVDEKYTLYSEKGDVESIPIH